MIGTTAKPSFISSRPMKQHCNRIEKNEVKQSQFETSLAKIPTVLKNEKSSVMMKASLLCH